MNPYYTDYSEYLERFFPGRKIQKISVNNGNGCPNRDGTIGTGGCIYCNNRSFTPGYCFDSGNVRAQLEAGKRFFRRKYKDMQYLAYFQSYTNTYGYSQEKLLKDYREALDTEDIVGLAIGTRPDTLPDSLLEKLEELNKERPLFVELGVETLCDETLRLINRGHDAKTATDSILRLAGRGLHVGAHLIAGLPGEDEERVLETLRLICGLPVESIKLHHLQVLRGTKLHQLAESGELTLHHPTPEEYLDFCVKVVKIVPRRIAIERFLSSAPPEMVASPKWGLKNYEFTNLLINRLRNETQTDHYNNMRHGGNRHERRHHSEG